VCVCVCVRVGVFFFGNRLLYTKRGFRCVRANEIYENITFLKKIYIYETRKKKEYDFFNTGYTMGSSVTIVVHWCLYLRNITYYA